ncbi:hypothetical protein Pla123a_48750 [Posidoniimonas polymericola]|uniref:PilZ domain-containing protein n=1 Tax=Posidoniimonas polymericola TaxID=2528002 RepID=A0A5C5XQE7_9BACT|nr:PilZ domain-containing protein [Posidoniimonas polymericola]TWT65407.1 hypothetical protein Pla123a_48750 [Posidoniimonas polymericola]
MLDAGNEQGVIDKLWSVAATHAMVPAQDRRSWQNNAATPTRFDSRRTFGRYTYGRRAILLLDGRTLGVYLNDVSREGVGFFSPVQLFPGHAYTLVMPGPTKVQVDIRRCRRVGEESYRCGGRFVEGEYLPPEEAGEPAEGGGGI